MFRIAPPFVQGIQPQWRGRGHSGGGYDPDAAAFFAAAGITDPTEKNAVNQLVLDLKSGSFWAGMIWLYPEVGGTSSTTSFNLINPSTYQVSWSGTATFNAQGVTADGSTSNGVTGLNTDTFGSTRSIGVYVENESNGGAEITSAFGSLSLSARAFGGFYASNYGFGTGRIAIGSIASSIGVSIATRTSSTACAAYRDGALIGTATDDGTAFSEAVNLFGATATTATIGTAFAYSGGLDDTQAAALTTIIQNFNSALSR